MIRGSGVGTSFSMTALAELAKPAWIKNAPLIDVFLVLNVLHERRPKFVTGVMLGAAVQRLVACEVQPGGPYKSAPDLIDPVANACIAVFVGWAGKPLPGLQKFLARHYDVTLLRTAAAPFDGRKVTLTPLAARLLAMQGTDPAIADSDGTTVKEWRADAQKVQDAALGAMADIPSEILRHSRKILQTFDHGDDRGEVRLLPAFFAAALTDAPDDAQFYTMLGAANMHTWLAYTIYDDFYDNEAQLHLLPAAHVSMRLAMRLYTEAVDVAEWRAFVSKAFDRVDAANAWEVSHCRFMVATEKLSIKDLPDMGNLEYIADRAYFHALGPMAVLARCGILPGDARWGAIWRGFGHYLVARQCNDDLLDWRADLSSGQATPIVLSLLKHLGVREGTHAFSDLMPRAGHIFWCDVLPEIFELAFGHIERARQAFAESGLLRLDAHGGLAQTKFNELLVYIETSLLEAQSARRQSQEFLSTFK